LFPSKRAKKKRIEKEKEHRKEIEIGKQMIVTSVIQDRDREAEKSVTRINP
jgi:hypothetical protein